MMETLLKDIRYGFRMMLKSRGLTAVAVLSLALGIGANTAIFTLVDKLLLRTLPVEQPEQLVTIASYNGENTSFSYPLYKDFRDRNEVFSGLYAYSPTPFSLSEGGDTERISGSLVSGNYFDVLGVKAALGRTFLPDEDATPSTHPVAVLSYRLWQSRFGSDPRILNKTIGLNGVTFSVVGVAPAEFTGVERGSSPEIYVPMMMQNEAMPSWSNALNSRNMSWLEMMGRLKPGIGREQAQASLAVTADQIAQAGEDKNISREMVVGDGSKGQDGRVREVSKPLIMLMVVVALVLLIACANVANLLLARAGVRRKEIAIRLAVGAGRGRLIRQLLTESITLSILGGVAGLFVARWLTNLLLAFQPPSSISLDDGLDLRVLGFSLLLSLLTGVVFGLAPALQTSKPDLVAALKDETMTVGRGARRLSLRNLLVVVPVALSLMVLISAGLCVRSLQKLLSIDAGFDPAKVMVMSLDLGLNGYKEAQGQQFYSEAVERVSTLRGVESVSLAAIVPLGGGGMRRSVQVEGYTLQPGERTLNFNMNIVGLKYFHTMGMPLAQGRDFGSQDREGAPKVVIINETVAHRFWPDESPVGRHLNFGGIGGRPDQLIEIIGVVKDSKYRSLTEEPTTSMFLPLAQNYRANMALHIRAVSEPKEMVAAVRREVQAMDANLPVYNIKTLAEQKSSSLYTSRMVATLLTFFGLLALLLAAIGIYGVMAYSVNRRTREIGIRMALGAKQTDVLRLVMGEGLILVAAGLAVGLGVTFAVTRVISSLLYGVSATDTATFIVISLVLAGVALGACFVPARRATKVDPMVALRYE
jgi:predicted permease